MYLRKKGEKPLTFDQMNMNFLCTPIMLYTAWYGADISDIHPLDPDIILENNLTSFKSEKQIVNIKINWDKLNEVKMSSYPPDCQAFVISLSKGNFKFFIPNTKITKEDEYIVLLSFKNDTGKWKFNPNISVVMKKGVENG